MSESSRKPLRIGIDARFFGGEQSKGLGRYTEKLIQHLFELDTVNHYVVFLQADGKERWLNQPYAQRPNVELVEAPYRWYSLAEQLFMPWLMYRAKVDFMHFPHFNVPLLYFGNFIVTIHDLIISRFPTERATTLGPIKYWFKQLAYNRVIKHAAYRAKKIITVSEYSKRDIMEVFSLPEDNITVTYEAVDGFVTTQASKPAVEILKTYGIQKPYLLYVGNAYPHKNLETLLAAMAQLKKMGDTSLRLVLVGKQDYFYEYIKQQAWALYIDDHVTFTGFVPDADLPTLYSEAQAYVFPSKYEGFGLPPLEAMYYGTPVVSANSSCLPEILGDAALYFDFQDVNGIIGRIQELRDPTVSREYSERGKRQVTKYSWSRMAQETLVIYNTLLAEEKQIETKDTPNDAKS